jgi:hypothetical protein
MKQKTGKLIKGSFEKISIQQKECIPIPLAKCREILNDNGIVYTDAEIEKIRDFLYEWAAMVYQETPLVKTKVISINELKTNDNEKCDYLRTG